MRRTSSGMRSPLFLFLLAGLSIAGTCQADANLIAQTDLFRAAEMSDLEEVKHLIGLGARPNFRLPHPPHGVTTTPLTVAAYKGQKKVAELLLDLGAGVDYPLEDGTTPLYLAAYQGHLDMVQLLLDRGAKINAENSDGFTALNVAIAGNHQNLMELLLDRGANINHVAHDGLTPLIAAAGFGYPELVKILLDHGARTDFKTHEGHTALLAAELIGEAPEVSDILISHGHLDFHQEIKAAEKLKAFQVAKKLHHYLKNTCHRKITQNREGFKISTAPLGDIQEDQLHTMVEACFNKTLAKQALQKQKQELELKVHHIKEHLSQENSTALKKAEFDIVNLESDTHCPICLECVFEKGKFASLPCQHTYCQDCYEKILAPASMQTSENHETDPSSETELNCPLCREGFCGKTVLEIETLHPEFKDQKCK